MRGNINFTSYAHTIQTGQQEKEKKLHWFSYVLSYFFNHSYHIISSILHLIVHLCFDYLSESYQIKNKIKNKLQQYHISVHIISSSNAMNRWCHSQFKLSHSRSRDFSCFGILRIPLSGFTCFFWLFSIFQGGSKN